MSGWQRWLFCVVVIVSHSPVLVGAEVIDGYVINPTTDERVANIEVAFSMAGPDGTFSEMMRKPSDTEGRFSFSGPLLAKGLTYSLTAFYQDIPYSSSALEVGAQRQVILEVFDPTDDDAQLHNAAHHLFLTMGAELLEVAQLMQVQNSGDATFVGSLGGQKSLVTELRLPDGVFNFRIAGQGEASAFVRERDRFFHTDPVLPGRTQIAFTFQIDLSKFSGTYEHIAPYDTERLDVYLQPSSIELGPPFHDLGLATLHDQSYRRYHLNDLVRSEAVSIVLPLSRPLRWALKWVALGLMLFASLASFGLSRRESQTSDRGPTTNLLAAAAGVEANASIGELEQLQGTLLARLADEQHPGDGQGGQVLNRTVALYRLLAWKKAQL